MVSEVQKELEKNEEKIQSKTQNIEEKQISKKPIKKKLSTKPKVQDKKNERFFNTIKETLAKKQIEIIDIIGFSKGDLTLKIKEKEKEKILVAYNKKRLTELDITNAYKKAKEHDMGYIIFTLGEPAKKTTSFIEAIKNLSSIEKIE
jgi:midasin (ATPase involved in ribosome maturation)